MDYLYSYEQIDEALVFQSRACKSLGVLKDGMHGAWLLKKDDSYFWDSDIAFSFDLLEKYQAIRQEMVSKNLDLFFAGGYFRACLYVRQKMGVGQDEPLENVVSFVSKAHSIKKALSLLNRKILLSNEEFVRNVDKTKSLVSFEDFSELQFIRRREKSLNKEGK